MGQEPVRALADEAIAAASRSPGRRVIGITGPPGAGKSTLTEALVQACARELGESSVAGLPMDGFHRPTRVLVALGRADRKGAPDTFDGGAFVAAVRGLLAPGAPAMTWPAYSRRTHEPMPDAIAVPSSTRLVFVEGNYLLLPESPWDQLVAMVSPIWYLDADRTMLRQRLLRRQLAAGLSAREAEDHVMRSDMRNAERIEATRGRADRLVQLSPDDPLLRGLRDPATGLPIELDGGSAQSI